MTLPTRVNPILAEETRGGRAESWHRGAAVLAGPDGEILWSVGDCDHPLFPRSAVKAIQALAMVECGAADAFGYGPEHLAVAQASHSGEPRHVALVEDILARAGLTPDDLECGVHRPSDKAAATELLLTRQPFTAVHNNCSGKHAAMLAAARHLGLTTKGYIDPDHPLQVLIRDLFQDLFGVSGLSTTCGIDGCSVPTYAVPLTAMATGMARFVTGEGMKEARKDAADAVYQAAVSEPFLVAGTGRFCTSAMRALGGRALVKTGAEGVFCVSLADRGLGLALKCDDGATRASEAMMAAILARLYPDADEAFTADKPVTNWRGFETGRVRAVDEPFEGLNAL